MRPRVKTAIRAGLALAISSLGLAAIPTAAVAAPAFQLPFPCNQTWAGNSGSSSAHRSWEIDFNRGGSATADLGDTVVAAASGTVRSAAYQTSNGYGNLVTIDHGGGWVSYYAHLKRMAVRTGERVLRGQAIGALGNTSRTNPGISPHLHFEVRLGTNYPSNIQKAVFNGSTFRYPAASVTSRNCASDYDPQALCGEGFEPNDSRALGSLGTVNLTWKDATNQNCVTTLKFSATGTRTYTKAYLRPAGRSTVQDQGNYYSYAGPVRAVAPSCITWGGTINSTTYNSPSEHC